jgi:hypothetical protein
MNNTNVIMIEHDESKMLYEYGPEWQTVVPKKKVNYVKRLLEETLEDAVNLANQVPGVVSTIDPVKWQEAYNKVLNQHYNYLTSFTSKDIAAKIEKKNTSENKNVRESNYIQLDCRKYHDGKELDMMQVDGYKFMINRFFGNDEFIKRLKKHYRLMGYNVGFSYSTVDDKVKYTHMKVYFK